VTRRVQRRLTFRRRTKGEPWSWRPLHPHGATCLSNHVDPVFYDPDVPEPLQIGRYDWLLRLYQHEGASPASVEHHGGIAYFETEWQSIRDREVEWLEHVNRRTGTVSRIDFGTALRYGSWHSTPRGDMWVVPHEQYSTK
jgi:hypothetical protein